MPAMSTGTFDVGVPPDFDLPQAGCQGKIDFLFVIESFYAMKKAQDKLQAAFSTFTDMIGQEFAEFDYHIMVVDTGGPLLNKCEDCYMCIGCTMPGCGDFGGPLDYPCDYDLSACDITRGRRRHRHRQLQRHEPALRAVRRQPLHHQGRARPRGDVQVHRHPGRGPQDAGGGGAHDVAALEPDMLDGGCNDGFCATTPCWRSSNSRAAATT
jgi:hypothetical protein